MTEHNDGRTFPPESDAARPVLYRYQPKHLKKRGGQKPFRLGVSCLALLLATVLLLVSGSFSYFSGGPSETGSFPTLTVATFGVEVAEGNEGPYYPGDDYGNKQLVLYSFEINNQSHVPVFCDIDFNVTITGYEQSGAEKIEDLSFLFIDEDKYDYANKDDSDYYLAMGVKSNSTATVDYDTTVEEDDIPPIYIEATGTKTFVLILDYNDCATNDQRKVTTTGTLTVTAEQADHAGEDY